MFLQTQKLFTNLCCLHARILSKDAKTLGKGYQRMNSKKQQSFCKLFGSNEASTSSSRCNTNEWLRDAFRCLGKNSSLLLYIQQNELCPIWILLRSGFETNRKQLSWIKGVVITLWIICLSSRDTHSAKCNRPTGWANYKQRCKSFRYVNGVLITRFSWRKELFCL